MNQWSQAGGLGAARAYHTATQLPNGDVVFVGGVSGNGNGNVAITEIYHVTTHNWERAGIPPPISHHAAGLLPDGQVLAIGGLRRGPFAPIRDCEIGPPASQ